MKSLLFSLTFLGLISISNAQVGIGTTTPASTFEVKKTVTSSTDATNPTTTKDGIIPPNVTKAELANKVFAPKTYDVAQTGTIVYVTNATAPTGTPASASQVVNVTAPGTYSFDGSVWTPIGGILKKVQGTFVASPANGILISTSSTTPINLGSYIDLPFGKWEVELNILLDVGNTRENSYTWTKLSFTDTATSINVSADVTSTSKLVSGGISTVLPATAGDANPFYGIIAGKVIITNTGATKRYYLLYVGSNYKGAVRNINRIGSTNASENFISATKID